MAVAIVINEGAPSAPSLGIIRQTRLHGYIRESAVAVIPVQDVLAEVGDEQVALREASPWPFVLRIGTPSESDARSSLREILITPPRWDA